MHDDQVDSGLRPRRSRASRWVAREFTLGNLITIAVLLAGLVSTWATQGSRLNAVEQHQIVQDKRLDTHDERFDNLKNEYVPRTELQDRLSTMAEDVRDIKTDLRQLEHDRR